MRGPSQLALPLFAFERCVSRDRRAAKGCRRNPRSASDSEIWRQCWNRSVARALTRVGGRAMARIWARIWKTPLFVLATAYFVLDGLFSYATRPFAAWLGRIGIFERVQRWIVFLRPY